MPRDSLYALPADLPVPVDDGAAAHLAGMRLPDVALLATDGSTVSLAALPGRTVVYAYPRTGEPGKAMLVPEWDQIPGARGDRVFGLSTQSRAYQREMAERLHLPFPVLSDEGLALTRALRLPTFEAGGLTLIKRLALVVDDGRITHVFYPVFPPDRNAADVLAWLERKPRG